MVWLNLFLGIQKWKIVSSACREEERDILKSQYFLYRAGIFKQSMGARNRVGIVLSYRPARLHRLAELIPWNRLLGSISV
jgi:hypothetical protein